MAASTKLYEKIVAATGLELDISTGLMQGVRNGYSVMVYAPDKQYPSSLQVAIAAKRNEPITKEEIKELRSNCKNVGKVIQGNNCLIVNVKALLANKLPEQVEQVTQTTVDFMAARGWEPCCQMCQKDGTMPVAMVGNNYMSVCDDCLTNLQQNAHLEQQNIVSKKESIVMGIVGAFLGSLLGALCIIIVSQMGYVAALSGLVMAICTLKGYEMLGGKLTKKGIIIAILIMIVMTYAADRLDWAIVVAREFEEDLFISYQAIPALIEAEIIETARYWGNLILVYLFLALGAVPTILAAFRQKDLTEIRRIGNNSHSM